MEILVLGYFFNKLITTGLTRMTSPSEENRMIKIFNLKKTFYTIQDSGFYRCTFSFVYTIS